LTRIAKSVARQALIIAGVACLWVIFFRLNSLFFNGFAHSVRAHWIFLPAALRVIALLLFDELAVVGLTVGAYMTLGLSERVIMPGAALLALSSGVAPWIAVAMWRRIFHIRRDLAGLRPLDVVALSLGSAVMNSALLNLVLTLTGEMPGDVEQIATIIVGDAVGTAIVLAILSGLLGVVAMKAKARR